MLRRLFGKRQEAQEAIPALDLSCGDFHFAIVGEASYLDELRRISNGRAERGERVEFRVAIIPDRDNKYDPNAIAVHAENGGIVGYFSRENAELYQPAILAMMKKQGRFPSCMAVMAGGHGEKRNIGVWLDLDLDTLAEHAS